MEWENREITNEPLRVAADDFVHITQYVYCHKPDVQCYIVYPDIPAIRDGSIANRKRRIWDPGGMQRIHTSPLDVITKEPNYSGLSDNAYNWTYTVYGKVEELLPVDAPESLNLMHKVDMRRPVTGILHFINKSPIEWYSKKQATRHSTASIKDGKAIFCAKGE
jgi:hypothetical protein